MNNYMDFLLWVKGPAFDIALFIFVAGIIIRIFEIIILGKKTDLSEPRSSGTRAGLRNIVSRSIPQQAILKKEPITIIVGYVWHIAWFISLFLFIPHIELFKSLTGLSWPGLPTPLVDFATIIAMGALLVALINRITHPVLRFLSNFEDYLVWLVTFLPLLTGYLAFNHLIDPYPFALALHILSAELFLIVFPFTKLMHAFTVFLARWYSGVALGRKEDPSNKELAS